MAHGGLTPSNLTPTRFAKEGGTEGGEVVPGRKGAAPLTEQWVGAGPSLERPPSHPLLCAVAPLFAMRKQAQSRKVAGPRSPS